MMVAVSLMPCGVSVSYWQPPSAGRGLPRAEEQGGSTEMPCPSPQGPFSLRSIK